MRHIVSRGATIGFALALGLTLAACDAGSGTPDTSVPASATPQPFAGSVTFNVAKKATMVPIDTKLRVKASESTLQQVSLEGPSGPVPGKLSKDQQSWVAQGTLLPKTSYKITAAAIDTEGTTKTVSRKFTTQELTLDQQTYPTFVPADGSTVGIGMPVIIRFDVPVTNHEEIQKHLVVQSTPAQAGGWHWISDNEVHWRPKVYWKPGTTVHVEANIGGVPAADGVWGQMDRSQTFHISKHAQVIKVNTQTDQLTFYRDGKLIKTIPITTGAQPAYTTRSGVKVIVEKDRYTNMNSETIGIPSNSSAGYDLKNVEFAMRLTYSGEFFHAAPWSVASQGRANVSHGCTGMSTENAGWLYRNTLIGDPAEFTGTTRQMTLDNGYGDWNLPFKQYIQGEPTNLPTPSAPTNSASPSASASSSSSPAAS